MAGVAGLSRRARPPRRAFTRARSGCLGAPFCRWQALPPRGALAASRALREVGCVARLKQAPLIVVLAALPSPVASLPVVFSDRCGDVALSRAGPKPRQTRDGHSWRMGPLFSLCLRAPRLSRPPDGGVWKAGVRTPARPRSPPPPASRRRRGQGSPDAADTLRPASAVSRVAALPAAGRAVPPSRPARLARSSGGAPGAFQVVPQVPEAESVASLSAPGGPVGSIPVKCVCGGRVGKVEGGKEAFSLSPLAGRRRVPRRVPPARVWRSGPDSDGRRAASHPPPRCWGQVPRGRSWRPGAGEFPAAGCL